MIAFPPGYLLLIQREYTDCSKKPHHLTSFFFPPLRLRAKDLKTWLQLLVSDLYAERASRAMMSWYDKGNQDIKIVENKSILARCHYFSDHAYQSGKLQFRKLRFMVYGNPFSKGLAPKRLPNHRICKSNKNHFPQKQKGNLIYQTVGWKILKEIKRLDMWWKNCQIFRSTVVPFYQKSSGLLVGDIYHQNWLRWYWGHQLMLLKIAWICSSQI